MNHFVTIIMCDPILSYLLITGILVSTKAPYPTQKRESSSSIQITRIYIFKIINIITSSLWYQRARIMG